MIPTRTRPLTWMAGLVLVAGLPIGGDAVGSAGQLSKGMPRPTFWVATGQDGAPTYVLFARGSELVRLDASTGRVAWRIELPSPADFGPVVAAETALILGCGGGFCLYGVDSRDGSVRWTKHLLDVTNRSRRMITDGERIFLDARQDEGVAALNPQKGSVDWEHTGLRTGFVKPLTVADHRLFTDVGLLDTATGGEVHYFGRDPEPLTGNLIAWHVGGDR